MADLEGSETREIDAPIQRVFDIAADIPHAPEWQGVMKSVEVIESDADGRASLVDVELDSGVVKNAIRMRFTYDEPHGLRWTRESGDLKSLEGRWDFEELGEGRTRATYSLEIGLNRALSLLRRTIKGPAEAKIRSLLTERPVDGLKERAEGG
ncbi:MAG TPA: SRPBCC family protein [Solirubrobacteraceae bacterium]